MHLGWTTLGSTGRSMVQRPPLIPSAWMLLSMRRSQWNRHPSLTWERRAAKAQKSQTPPRAPHVTTPQGATPNSASWADEDQVEGEEQEETKWEEWPTPPASPQKEHMEELPTLEQESLGMVLNGPIICN